ncbi:transporter substrate-binding domain-containing protein [Pseudoalteromonas sp. MMG010]|uniref:substrate-binding periplasmic protein n=1 Tax=Pseudoalteromonas sp. MMG010 TaxID=2822685 RepID=UPI001B3A2739|nr:transporter substrate-binding domain-containing protein [Pseudoalteromonas sp. MMG010]MBQ4831858.1 transporter substrate-binding domain-containing protein [Pseudoalteromonas sp. MMG010]
MIKNLSSTLLLFFSVNVLAHPSWQIVTQSFPPYISSEASGNSWLVDVTQAALSSQNINSTIELTSWSRAIKLTERSKRTALLGAYYSKSRNEVFYYSRAIAQAKTGFFKRSDNKIKYNGVLDSIKNHSICAGKNYLVSEEFSNNKDLIVTMSEDLKTCLTLLINGRVELAAGTKKNGEHILKEQALIPASSQIKIEYMEPNIAKHNVHLIIAKADKLGAEKLAAFENGIDKIKANGELQKILKKHHFSQQEIADYIAFIK